jgi:hypothetical protein
MPLTNLYTIDKNAEFERIIRNNIGMFYKHAPLYTLSLTNLYAEGEHVNRIEYFYCMFSKFPFLRSLSPTNLSAEGNYYGLGTCE